MGQNATVEGVEVPTTASHDPKNIGPPVFGRKDVIKILNFCVKVAVNTYLVIRKEEVSSERKATVMG